MKVDDGFLSIKMIILNLCHPIHIIVFIMDFAESSVSQNPMTTQ